MDYKDLSPAKQRYLSLAKYLGATKDIEKGIDILTDEQAEAFIKLMEDMIDKKRNGGIVSLNQLTRPIGMM